MSRAEARERAETRAPPDPPRPTQAFTAPESGDRPPGNRVGQTVGVDQFTQGCGEPVDGHTTARGETGFRRDLR
jgi:hypothetical protein